jgi:hypothetical protein
MSICPLFFIAPIRLELGTAVSQSRVPLKASTAITALSAGTKTRPSLARGDMGRWCRSTILRGPGLPNHWRVIGPSIASPLQAVWPASA